MSHLLDTNTCIYFLNGSHPGLVARVLDSSPADLAVSSLSVGELAFGAARSARPKPNLARVHAFLAEVVVVPFDREAAERFGALKGTLVAKGRTIGDFDLAIAAIALTHGLTLVTSDRDFDRVPALRREDWAA